MKNAAGVNRFLKYALCVLSGALAMAVILVLCMGGFGVFSRALKFASVLHLVDSQFVGDYDLDQITDEALAGAVYSLDDDWSYYMDADSFQAYEDYSANQYQGIGVTITKDSETGGFAIVSLEKDGPAHRAGLAAGDIILAADGKSAADMTTEDLRAVIQADFGGQALLTVRHADGTEEDVSVSCELVYDDPVSGELLRDHVGYIVIENFHTGAGQEVLDMIDALLDQGADSFIFDVRNDPGGQVNELTMVLDRLLPEGTIFRQTDRHGKESVETSDETCLDLPMAVVVNGESYSAAEFFAAALQEYDWAVVVGQPTTGKSRSQVTYYLRDGSAVHLSHYSYLTPNGVDLYEQGGLTPDVEAALDGEQAQLYATGWLEPEDDSQIQAALDALGA